MFNNYYYFLVLTEEMNITRAANRLFISHQSLSSYLRNIETQFGVSLFVRKPNLALTPAGEAMLASLREVERIEHNLLSQFSNIKDEQSGVVNFGITEGRYRILIPNLLKRFRAMYPNVDLRVFSSTSLEMNEKILNNEIDMFFGGTDNMHSNRLKFDVVAEEHLFLTISDNLLKKYFPDTFPRCKEEFAKGVDLRLFKDVPFVLNKRKFSSRVLLDAHLAKLHIDLNCIVELTQPDIHHLLSEVDYAASFCLSMYIDSIKRINKQTDTDSKLNVFPINGLTETNIVSLVYLKDKIFPKYAKDLIKLTKELCQELIA